MNADRMRRLIDQQTGIATKVLEAVPLQETWPTSSVSRELFRVGTRIDKDTLEGCLKSLKESGLIKEPHPGEWRRVRVPAREEAEPEAERIGSVRAVPPAKDDPLARLGAASSRLRGLASVLLEVAEEIDAAALAMEDRVQAAGTDTHKLRQLQSLLRDIGGAA